MFSLAVKKRLNTIGMNPYAENCVLLILGIGSNQNLSKWIHFIVRSSMANQIVA